MLFFMTWFGFPAMIEVYLGLPREKIHGFDESNHPLRMVSWKLNITYVFWRWLGTPIITREFDWLDDKGCGPTPVSPWAKLGKHWLSQKKIKKWLFHLWFFNHHQSPFTTIKERLWVPCRKSRFWEWCELGHRCRANREFRSLQNFSELIVFAIEQWKNQWFF